jgi:hypothetical protein|tara:strand:+ start:4001 stop:4183 length:183 start_codon:yes stop_codon:yes gene_type:complete
MTIREEFEELKALVKVYLETKYDDGDMYDDDTEWAEALEEMEVDLCIAVGLLDEEDLDIE